MNNTYNSDKPIPTKDHDRFNRYNFSKRIAETIVKRNSEEGLVIGLYGIWGEGKTSVLNMIEEDLKESNDVLIVKFNPWRFKDEDTLILHFLKNISNTLDIELETKKEKLGGFIKKYGGIGSAFNFDISKIGKILSDIELEDLKNRVNEFLKESNKKVAIIIDDIDRLDKQELFSLFKLIKLTGDFKNTYYILSFDDEMVASAIGERFAEGNKDAGYNFLEKIIQVPLRIPQVLSNDLLEYLFELLNKILDENQIELADEQNLGYLIYQNILERIKTPRLALRYANSLTFLIPLLKGEVSISDLILLEAIKIFYPKYYEFIKNTPVYFIENYTQKFDRNNDIEKIEEFKKKIDFLSNDLSKTEKNAILELIKYLFPYTKQALHNRGVSKLNNDWEKEKRISSEKYFNRYFIYSVPRNDISDIYFNNYIVRLNTDPLAKIVEDTNNILKKIEPTEFLFKISLYEDNMEWGGRKVLIKLICDNQSKFEGMKGGTLMFGLRNPKMQAAITISRLLAKHENYDERVEFAETLMSTDVTFEFSKEMLRWFAVGENEEDQTIKDNEIKLLNTNLLERAIKDCDDNNDNLFERYENHIFSLLSFWYDKNKIELSEYIARLIESNQNMAENIIWSLTSTIYSSSTPDPYKVNFQKEAFDSLKKYYDVTKIYEILMNTNKDEIESVEVYFSDNSPGQLKINAVRQFVHWFNEDLQSQMQNLEEYKVEN